MKRQPIYDINDYLLNGTDVGSLLGWPNESGLRPFIPIQQQPEANDRTSRDAYVVYNFRTIGGADWWTQTDEVSYIVWGSSFEQLSEIANTIVDNLRAMDDSAQDIMDWLSASYGKHDWFFHYVRVLSSFSPDPAGQEAGHLGWLITFRYEYSPVNGKHIG